MRFLVAAFLIFFTNSTFATLDSKGVCAKSSFANPEFTKTYSLKNGLKIHLCGYGNEEKGYSQLLVGSTDHAKRSDIFLGGAKEAYAIFDVQYVKVIFKDDGLDVWDLIPAASGDLKPTAVPAFERHIHCGADTCVEEKEKKCVFQKAAHAGDAKDTAQVIRASKTQKGDFPSDSQLVEAYYSALAGNRSATSALLDKRFFKRYKDVIEKRGDSVEGSALAEVVTTLGKLRSSGCL